MFEEIAERRSVCAAGFLSFNRVSQRSGNRTARLTSAEASFLVGALQKAGDAARFNRLAERRSACAAGYGLNEEYVFVTFLLAQISED